MAWRRTWNEPPDEPAGVRGWFGGGWPRRRRFPAVKTIVLATVIVFIVDMIFKVALRSPMGLLTYFGALRVTNAFLLYPLVTYQFLHGGIFHIAINMLILWMLGRYIEQRLGTRRFVAMYLVSGVVGGLFQVGFNVLMTRWLGPDILGQPTVGASGAVMGVLMAFACLYPRTELLIFIFFFPVPIEARWLALGYFIIESLAAWQGVATGMASGVAHAAHVGGLVVGYVWVKHGSHLAAIGRWFTARSGPEVRRQAPSGPGPGTPDQAEVDRILAKIHREGIDSLTTREKLFLQDMSRRFRDEP